MPPFYLVSYPVLSCDVQFPAHLYCEPKRNSPRWWYLYANIRGKITYC